MKNIIIKTLSIINFKGIKSKKIDFNLVTNIYGANASGKTTIFDAFTFLLFGKDSSDRKDFEIKPLDANGKTIDRTENEVNAILEVNGEEIHLRHVMKEKWVKKRGESVAEFSGNEHLYFWNDVPMLAGEYQAKIEAILPEHIFKLLTNPLYFNSMKWQDRRAVLQEIAGEVTDSEIIAQKPEFSDLIAMLSGKTIKEIRAQNAAEKKRLKEALSTIPARIDEIERGKPETGNEAELQAKVDNLYAEYKSIDKQIDDRNEAQKAENEAIQVINKQIHEFKTENLAIQAKHQQEYNAELLNSQSAGKDLSIKIVNKQADLRNVQASLQGQELQLSSLENLHKARLARIERDRADTNSQVKGLRTLWAMVSAREINPNKLKCKECGREHEAHNLDQVVSDFNENKTKELNSINERGVALKADLAKYDADQEQSVSEYELSKAALDKSIIDLKNQIASIEEEIKQLQEQLNQVNENKVVVVSVTERLLADEKHQENLEHIAQLERSLLDRPGVDISDLRLAKDEITAELDELKKKLNTKDQIEAADKRIAELKEQERVMSQELADIEKFEFTAQSYEKFKSEELQRRVNGMFKYAEFKLFNQLINGGEEPTCVTTFKGVPFTDLNNAGKIMIGIDIINTLSAFHGVTAPLFLDNRESVSAIPDTAAQVINLIVSESDKQLRVA